MGSPGAVDGLPPTGTGDRGTTSFRLPHCSSLHTDHYSGYHILQSLNDLIQLLMSLVNSSWIELLGVCARTHVCVRVRMCVCVYACAHMCVYVCVCGWVGGAVLTKSAMSGSTLYCSIINLTAAISPLRAAQCRAV